VVRFFDRQYNFNAVHYNIPVNFSGNIWRSNFYFPNIIEGKQKSRKGKAIEMILIIILVVGTGKDGKGRIKTAGH